MYNKFNCATSLNTLYDRGLKSVVDTSLKITIHDPCNLNSDLCKLVNRYAYQGTYKFSSVYQNGIGYVLVKPTLYINGKAMGTLDRLKVQAIKALAEPSPSTPGSKEIKGNRINLEFDCPRELEAMAPAGYKISPRLYKLAIYETDGVVAEQADTLYGEDHIGTLVVCLPVPHEGGALILSDDKNELRLPFDGMANEDNISWVAFYSDVKHQVEVEKSGMRMVLQFGLRFERMDEDHRAMFATPDYRENMYKFKGYNKEISKVIQEKLKNNLSAPKTEPTEVKPKDSAPPQGIAILLRRQYGAFSLSPDKLKGADRFLYDALKDNFRVALKYVIVEQTTAYSGGYKGQPVSIVGLSKVEQVQDPASEEEKEEEKKDELDVDVDKQHVPKKCDDGEDIRTADLDGEGGKEVEKKVYLVTGSLPKINYWYVIHGHNDYMETEDGTRSYKHAALFVYLK